MQTSCSQVADKKDRQVSKWDRKEHEKKTCMRQWIKTGRSGLISRKETS